MTTNYFNNQENEILHSITSDSSVKKNETFNALPLMPHFDAPVISLQLSAGYPLDHFRQVNRQLKTQLIRVVILHLCHLICYILNFSHIST